MLIIPILYNREELEDLCDRSDLFDLYLDYAPQQCYLVIQGNKITWLGMGTVPKEVAYQINTRTFIMNETKGIGKNHGKAGFLGDFSGIDDALHKIFPSKGYCINNMCLEEYTGQKLKGHKHHYVVIEPILALVGRNPNEDLQHFFQVFKWGDRKKFCCSGQFLNDMHLFIDNEEILNLETWFINFCKIALNENKASSERANNSNEDAMTNVIGGIFWIIVIVVLFKSCS